MVSTSDLTLGVFFFLLRRFDSAVTMKPSNSFYIPPFVFVIFIFIVLFSWRGVLMRNQLSTPKFINMSDATV